MPKKRDYKKSKQLLVPVDLDVLSNSGIAGVNANLQMTVALCGGVRDDYLSVATCWGYLVDTFAVSAQRESKDGPAIILADIRNFREDRDVVCVTALGHEIDGKLAFDDVCRRVASAGWESVVYTTHNHLRTSQHVGLSSYLKWLGEQKPAEDATGDSSLLSRYCASKPKYSHLRDVRSANGGRVTKVRMFGKSVEVITILHAPEHKTRVISPLAKPLILAGSDLNGLAFRRAYHLHGAAIFDGAYSSESCNPARLHYLPSHQKGMASGVLHFPGELLDLTSEFEAAKLTASVATAPRVPTALSDASELAYYLGRIPPDIDYPTWFKIIAAIHRETDGQDHGNELAHEWSSGDPRYEFDQVEAIWDSLDPDHARPATKATLIKLAKTFEPALQRFRHAGLAFHYLDLMINGDADE